MADIVPTIRSVGANSVTFEAGAVFANGDTLTFAALKAAILLFAAAQSHKIYGLKNGQLLSFLSGTYASNAAAATEFAKKGGLVATVGTSGSTATGSLAVAQTQFLGAAAATGAAPIVRISLASSIAA